MTVETFLNTVHFDHWGFVPPLDLKKGGRYTYVTEAYDKDRNLYDILCDDNMNFYYHLKKEVRK